MYVCMHVVSVCTYCMYYVNMILEQKMYVCMYVYMCVCRVVSYPNVSSSSIAGSKVRML